MGRLWNTRVLLQSHDNDQWHDNCLCRNCGNCDKSSNSRSLIQRSLKRKRENPSPYKKKSSAEFLASKGRHPSAGPWTTHEKCLLLSCISLIRATAVNPTVENITSLYNNVINSDVRKHTDYPMREKSITQVSKKLAHLGEKQAVLNVLRNSGHWKAANESNCDMHQILTFLGKNW